MFTGIVEEVGRVVSSGTANLVVAAEQVIQGMALGQSIAVNGICLTVTRFDSKSFSVDVMPETLSRTNLGGLSSGDQVNLERPLALGGQVGGHLVQGHVDATGKVTAVVWEGAAILITFEAPHEVTRYVVEKGFIAVDGISLTVAARDTGSFQVSTVDFTRRNTILGERKVGDQVNLEVDIIAKYVEQFTQSQRTSGVTVDFLQEHGFLVG
ncbi:riboflavin synthase [Chloroflexota bacterium]